MLKVIEAVEYQPGPKPAVLAHELARGSVPPPDEGVPIEFRPDGNDSGRAIPTPQPLVFSRTRIRRLHHNRSLAEGAFSEITISGPRIIGTRP
jgi:hypothetical protein